MSGVLEEMVGAAKRAGVASPIDPAQIKDWIRETRRFFDEERDQFGVAPKWDCLFRDWGSPGMYVLAEFSAGRVRLSAGRVNDSEKLQVRAAIDDASEAGPLLSALEVIAGKLFWQAEVREDELQ